MINEETDVADVNCLLDCVIRSEYAWDRDTPDKWWTDAFDTRRKAGGPLDPSFWGVGWRLQGSSECAAGSACCPGLLPGIV